MYHCTHHRPLGQMGSSSLKNMNNNVRLIHRYGMVNSVNNSEEFYYGTKM